MTEGGGRGSLSSGMDSWTGAVPLTVLGASVSMVDSGMGPFGATSVLAWRVRLGESDLWDVLGLCERRRGDGGRSAVVASEEPWLSRSFDLPLPNPLNAEPRFDEDFRSGDVVRPYGCALCLRRPNTVPNRLRGLELCFSGTEPLFWLLLSSAAVGDVGPEVGGARLREGVGGLLGFREGWGASPLRILKAHVCISSAVSMFNMAFSVSSAVVRLRST
jgi:hypothetical protein